LIPLISFSSIIPKNSKSQDFLTATKKWSDISGKKFDVETP